MGNRSKVANYSGAAPPGRQCLDVNGKSIPEGFLFVPEPDPCKVCTCVEGDAQVCRNVYCAPPHDCRNVRVRNGCCDWICLDDLGEAGGPFINTKVNSYDSSGTDIGLRLLASSVTAIISLCLLFFLVYRLRKRNRNGSETSYENADYPMTHTGGDGETTQEADSDGMQFDSDGCRYAESYSGRGDREGFVTAAWWKPGSLLAATVTAPPTYDDAMASEREGGSARTRVIRLGLPGADPAEVEADVDDVDGCSLDSDGSEAPPYSEVHNDPIIHRQVGEPPPLPHTRAVPTGAALVLPVPAPPVWVLNHVERGDRTCGNSQQNATDLSGEGDCKGSGADESSGTEVPTHDGPRRPREDET